jgi:tRNA(Arg) A34 adenosine deaminase TadA
VTAPLHRRSLLAQVLSTSLLAIGARSACGQPGGGAAAHPDRRWYEAALSMKQRAESWGDQPYGAVLVLGHELVGEGPSRVVQRRDSTAHAEREAIRDAQRRLKRIDLAGSVLYSTSRPCAACEAAAAAAGVGRMIFGEDLTDAGVPRLMSANPASDAPEHREPSPLARETGESYQNALQIWSTPEDVNAWIGARFEYDMARAILLSETQRFRNVRLAITQPGEFYREPRGVCVDLSRFAVETLRTVDRRLEPSYLMIEFEPLSIAGNTLRLHWLAAFRRDGRLFFFADSKRPGHLAGPYETTGEFIQEYQRYRGRKVVSFRELESYERKLRRPAIKTQRDEPP